MVLAAVQHCSPGVETVMTPNGSSPAATSEPDLARTSDELRALASWYRDFAEQAGNPMIWDYRVSTAEDLERQAAVLEGTGPCVV
jgi:hypothetical protein